MIPKLLIHEILNKFYPQLILKKHLLNYEIRVLGPSEKYSDILLLLGITILDGNMRKNLAFVMSFQPWIGALYILRFIDLNIILYDRAIKLNFEKFITKNHPTNIIDNSNWLGLVMDYYSHYFCFSDINLQYHKQNMELFSNSTLITFGTSLKEIIHPIFPLKIVNDEI